MICGHFDSTRGYFVVQWPTILGYLAFQEEGQGAPQQQRENLRNSVTVAHGVVLWVSCCLTRFHHLRPLGLDIREVV